ncbi:hypothetical protein LCGC14_3060350, partial [marine sediment metagenome]
WMSDDIMVKNYPDEKLRLIISNSRWDEQISINTKNEPIVKVVVDGEPLLDEVKNEINKIKEESFSINVKPVEDELMERRTLELDEFRFDAEKNELTGTAALFGVWSDDLGGFKEKIRQGAFSKTIKDGDVRLLFNHDPNFILARTSNGTMSLEEDKRGLQFTASLPNTTYANDLKESIKRGDISQNSFGFRVINDKWKISDDRNKLDERTLTEVKLFDVSPVTFPAYPQTTVKVRSILKGIDYDPELVAEMYRKIEKGIITKEERESIIETIKRLLEKFVEPETKEPIIENHSKEVVEPRSNLTRIREREMELFVKYM